MLTKAYILARRAKERTIRAERLEVVTTGDTAEGNHGKGKNTLTSKKGAKSNQGKNGKARSGKVADGSVSDEGYHSNGTGRGGKYIELTTMSDARQEQQLGGENDDCGGGDGIQIGESTPLTPRGDSNAHQDDVSTVSLLHVADTSETAPGVAGDGKSGDNNDKTRAQSQRRGDDDVQEEEGGEQQQQQREQQRERGNNSAVPSFSLSRRSFRYASERVSVDTNLEKVTLTARVLNDGDDDGEQEGNNQSPSRSSPDPETVSYIYVLEREQPPPGAGWESTDVVAYLLMGQWSIPKSTSGDVTSPQAPRRLLVLGDGTCLELSQVYGLEDKEALECVVCLTGMCAADPSPPLFIHSFIYICNPCFFKKIYMFSHIIFLLLKKKKLRQTTRLSHFFHVDTPACARDAMPCLKNVPSAVRILPHTSSLRSPKTITSSSHNMSKYIF